MRRPKKFEKKPQSCFDFFSVGDFFQIFLAFSEQQQHQTTTTTTTTTPHNNNKQQQQPQHQQE